MVSTGRVVYAHLFLDTLSMHQPIVFNPVTHVDYALSSSFIRLHTFQINETKNANRSILALLGRNKTKSMAHNLVPPSISLPTTSTPKRIAHLFHSADGQRQQVYTKREIMYGLSTIAIGSLVAPDSAKAAKRRSPPPQSTEEKKDPNLSALQAKLLASKKRKEAMKDTVAKLRENGKSVK